MKRITIIVGIWLVAASGLLFAQDPLKEMMNASLKGLSGIRVVVVVDPPEYESKGLNRDALSEVFSGILKKYNVKLLTMEDMAKGLVDLDSEMPYLTVTYSLKSTQGNPQLIGSASVEITQLVRLIRKNPADQATTPVNSWREEALWSGNADNLKQFADAVVDPLIKFIRAYASANSR